MPKSLVTMTAALAALACGESVTVPQTDESPTADVVVVEEDGLIQRIELSNASPSVGDTLMVRSTITNDGDATTVLARTCGMDIRGIALQALGATCQAYSLSAELPPGASIVGTTGGLVASAAGTYRVRVRHLLDPERWVEFDLTVEP